MQFLLEAIVLTGVGGRDRNLARGKHCIPDPHADAVHSGERVSVVGYAWSGDVRRRRFVFRVLSGKSRRQSRPHRLPQVRMTRTRSELESTRPRFHDRRTHAHDGRGERDARLLLRRRDDSWIPTPPLLTRCSWSSKAQTSSISERNRPGPDRSASTRAKNCGDWFRC